MLQVLRYGNISQSDFSRLTKIMADAYHDNSSMQAGLREEGPTRYDENTLFRRICNNPNYISKKIIYQNEIIGVFILNKHSEDNYELKMILVSPKYENRGFGAIIWKDIENSYMKVKKWTVEVPDYTDKLHYFFTVKCGFYIKNEKEYVNGNRVFIYEKLNS